MNNPLRDYNNRRRYWALKEKRLTEHEKIVERAFLKYLEGQKERVLSAMPKKSFVEQIFNKEREAQLAATVMFPALKEVMEQEGQEVAGRFDAPFTFTSEMDHWLKERAETFSKQINDTTYEQLSSELSAGVEAGEDYSQMADRISDKYGEISVGRAKTIARTEAHGAQQKANFEGYKQVGVPTKIWVAVMDTETRDTHAGIDGDEVPFDRPFDNGLMFPGDPNGPASETVNCRCTI